MAVLLYHLTLPRFPGAQVGFHASGLRERPQKPALCQSIRELIGGQEWWWLELWVSAHPPPTPEKQSSTTGLGAKWGACLTPLGYTMVGPQGKATGQAELACDSSSTGGTGVS